MLVEFTVSNFRSIRERQSISLEAAKRYKDHPDNVKHLNVPGLSGGLLKGAAIYGPNAAGKSNMLKALAFMGSFVAGSHMKPLDAPTGAVPFALDRESAARPSEFEAFFVVAGRLYQYGFSVSPDRVHVEYLYSFDDAGLRVKWFRRRWSNSSNRYLWSSGDTYEIDPAIRKKVRSDTLLLSVGPQFNDTALIPLHQWFAESLQFADLAPAGFGPHFTAGQLDAGGKLRFEIMELLRAADMNVADALVTRKQVGLADLPFRDELPPALIRILERTETVEALNVTLSHRGVDGDLHGIDLEQESNGTQRYFQLAGPWLDALQNGHVFLLDELETSLHPTLVEELLKLFFSRRNMSGAQVIFTTHNHMLLDSGVLRRDQVWFTERDEVGRTSVYPLTDYRPRNDELLTRGYISGRYGALPLVHFSNGEN